jgi:hypothetical protein
MGRLRVDGCSVENILFFALWWGERPRVPQQKTPIKIGKYVFYRARRDALRYGNSGFRV